MIKSVSQSFAKAAFKHAKKSKQVDQWFQLLQTLSQMLAHAKFKQAINAPIGITKQIQLIQDIAQPSPTQTAWIRLVLKTKQFNQMTEIAAAFKALHNLDQQQDSLQVISREPLNESQRRTITEKMQAILNNKPHIEFKTQDILGGIIMHYKGKVIDMSFNRILKQLTIK